MKTLQVSNIDTSGSRFNGSDLHRKLLEKGINSHLCVRIKKTSDQYTWKIANVFGIRILNFAIKQLEKILSVQSLLYPSSVQFYYDKRFNNVDVVHYHLIHTGFFSILTLPKLSKMKPSLWTLHDPWAITGHCYHPYDCQRWKTGCGKCPHLNTHLRMYIDHTNFMWKIKKWVFKNSKLDVVVASKWMYNMAKASPLLSNTKIHLIPFGIDLDQFCPNDMKQAKIKFEIDPDSFVIGFRSTKIEFKGLKYIKECLKDLNTQGKNISILTIDKKNLLNDLKDKYQIFDLGWLNEKELPSFYNACDVFLMPSVAETFGLMAVEAMACGKPVVVFDETSLSDVVFSPVGGLAVKYADSNALKDAIEYLIDNIEIRKSIGLNARKLAIENYDQEVFVNNIINLYNTKINDK